MKLALSIAWKYLKSHTGRNLLTSMGVALGVALATALLVANHSAQQSLTVQIEKRYGKYDIQFGYTSNGSYISNEKLESFKQKANQAVYSKVYIPYLKEIPKEVLNQPTSWGVEENSPEMKLYPLEQGRYPKQGAEVALSSAYATRKKIGVGNLISFSFPPYGNKTVRVVGILGTPVSRSGNMSFFPLEWLQEVFHHQGQSNLIQVTLLNKDPLYKSYLLTELKNDFPKVRVDARTYVDKSYEKMNVFRPLTYGLGFIALLVSSVLVLGSFNLSVRTRMKQWASLRAIGMNSGSIFSIIINEALMIGLLGTVAGLVVGCLLSSQALAVINRWLEIKQTQVEIQGATLVAVGVFGMLLSVMGSIFPALKAKNVPPAQVLRPETNGTILAKQKKNLFGFLLLGLGILLGMSSQFVPRSESMGLIVSGTSSILMSVGFLLSISNLVSLSTQFLSLITKPIILTRIAARNIIRYRDRSGFAVMTLALGLAIGVAAYVFIQSSMSTLESKMKEQFPSDLLVRLSGSDESTLLPQKVGEQIKQFPGVDQLARVSQTPAKLINYNKNKMDPIWIQFVDQRKDDPVTIDSIEIWPIDEKPLTRLLGLKLKDSGQPMPNLRPGQGIMTKEMAGYLGLKAGDLIQVQSRLSGYKAEIKIIGILEKYPKSVGVPFVLVDHDWGMRLTGAKGYNEFHIDLDSTPSSVKVEDQVKHILSKQPGAEYLSFTKALNEQKNMFRQQLLLIKALIAIIMGISGIGLVNAILSSLYDRRVEMGILKAIGTTPSQLFGITCMEGMYLGIGSGVMGISGGILLAYILLNTMEFSRLVIPWAVLLVIFLSSITLGIVAAGIANLWAKRLLSVQVIKEIV
ncbi:FtsX-like permease family protein [Laceyella putida]|uniref:FtsX-like permease family protein n=1 Tax=Laceyella putida TaxID=110101 RepID=A0ABW2RPX2_9BACL